MKLIDDWKKQWPKLWSVRLALLAALASAIEVAVQGYLSGAPPLFAIASFCTSIGAAIARIVAQPSLHHE